uniref:G protein-coupled receptor n=1 Tax=Steinernema glaseri TaxID=37863 RepID=A0A1I7XX93_9BILA
MRHNDGDNLLRSIEEKVENLRGQDSDCLSQRETFFRRLVISQPMFSHYFKLVTLFTLAICHFFYLFPFLKSYDAVQDYVRQLSYKYVLPYTVQGDDTRVLHYQLEIMNSYKQNSWMSIGSMCVALATSSFFLFIAPTTHIRKSHFIIMQTVDLVAFVTIPMLLIVRIAIVQAIENGLQVALASASKLASSDYFENELQCSISPSNDLPDCAEQIIGSVFPVALLKYLVILCVVSIAYIVLAYLIVYCIRHWFPHDKEVCCMRNKTYVPVFTSQSAPQPIPGILRKV